MECKHLNGKGLGDRISTRGDSLDGADRQAVRSLVGKTATAGLAPRCAPAGQISVAINPPFRIVASIEK